MFLQIGGFLSRGPSPLYQGDRTDDDPYSEPGDRQRRTIFPTPSPAAGQAGAWAGIRPAPLADSVDQAYTPTLKLLNLPQFKTTTTFRRRKESLPLTGDQRINNKPEFIHQPGIDKARRSASAPDEIDVLAGLLLEGGNFFESPEESRL